MTTKMINVPNRKPDWESEKCVAWDLRGEFTQCSSLTHTKRLRFFAPKSMVKEGQLPLWFVNNKIDEISDLGKYEVNFH